MKKLILLMAALALAACASLNASANQSELSLNQQKWQDANISHYRYNLAISCFCVFTQDMPLIIEVKNGEVVSMEYSTGNAINHLLNDHDITNEGKKQPVSIFLLFFINYRKLLIYFTILLYRTS